MSAHRFWQVYVPPEGKPTSLLQISEIKLRSSIGVDPTYPPVTADSSSISNRSSNILGAASLALLQNGNVDDTYLAVSLPFYVKFFGGTYNTVYVSSNSFVSFGAGSATPGPSAANPNVPSIQINGADRSYQRVYGGAENGGDTFRIRFEGSVSTGGTVGSPTMEWEMTFSRINPEIVLIDMGSNSASGGSSLISDGATSQQVFASGTNNTGYTFTLVAGSNPFSASSIAGANTAAAAFDANTSTYWNNAGSGIAEYITCDFGTAVDLVEVVIVAGTTPSYAPRTFQLRYSDDGKSFVSYYQSPDASWSSSAEVKTFLLSSGLIGAGHVNGFLSKVLYDVEPLSVELDITRYDYEDRVPFCSRRFLGGLFGIQGTTTSLGIPTAKRVDLVDQASGILIAQAATGEDGAFKFNHIIEGEYSLVGVDNTGEQNSVIYAHVVSVVL